MFNNCYDHAGNYLQSQTVQYHISHVPFHIKMNTIKLIKYANQLTSTTNYCNCKRKIICIIWGALIKILMYFDQIPFIIMVVNISVVFIVK